VPLLFVRCKAAAAIGGDGITAASELQRFHTSTGIDVFEAAGDVTLAISEKRPARAKLSKMLPQASLPLIEKRTDPSSWH